VTHFVLPNRFAQGKSSLHHGHSLSRSALLSNAAALSVDKADSLPPPHGHDTDSHMLNSGEYGLCYITCARCQCRMEAYGEDTLGSLLVICSTLVYRCSV
jgi:hypothetical protein